MFKMKKVIDGERRKKALIEIKPVKNISKNPEFPRVKKSFIYQGRI